MDRDCIIYECNQCYYVVQRSPQDRVNKAGPSENVALVGELPIVADLRLLGDAVRKALDQYGMVEPAFYPWQLKELRKLLCSWLGVKSYSTLIRSSRMVVVMVGEGKEEVRVIPFDNNNLNPWETQMEDKAISLPLYESTAALGEAIFQAFLLSTAHPNN